MKEQEAIAALFDSWAGEARGEQMARGHDELVAAIFELWSLDASSSVLDVACGNGRALSQARQRGVATLAGIDVSAGMAAQAQKNVATADIRTGAAEQLPWEDGSFTHVLSVEAFYYLPDPLAGLKEIRRVLKPGGHVAIAIEFYAENKGSHVWADALPFDLTLLGEQAWRQLLIDAGFEEAHTKRIVRREPLKQEDDFKASPFFPTYALYQNYMEAGALMVFS